MAVLGVPGGLAAVFAAAYAGLRLVARRPEATKHGWQEAVEAWTKARDALRKARTERKKAAAEAGRREAQQAVAEAARTLTDKDEEMSRRRDALAAARDELRKCATDSCWAWRRDVLAKRRQTVRRAWRKGRKQLKVFLCRYIRGAAKDLPERKNLPKLKDLLSGEYWIAAPLVSLALSLVAVYVDLLYYRNFRLNALPFYTSASLPALASTALLLLVVIAFLFAVFLASVTGLFVGVRIGFWLPNLAATGLKWVLLVVLSPLPLLVSRSAFCARLAAPEPENEAR